MGSGAEVPFDNGVVGQDEWRARDEQSDDKASHPAISTLMGHSANEVQAIVDQARADPIAESYRKLKPVDRYAKVQEIESS